MKGEIRTLYSLQDLADSAFNQLPPRHGLRLLHWFANGNRYGRLTYKPPAYGFHWFNNNNGGANLLPDDDFHYYEVGNLNAEGAAQLPPHVRPKEQVYYGKNNKDRIIVRVNQGRIDRVYVTEHDGNNFSPDHTYLISQKLLDQISNMTKDEFASYMKPRQQQQQQHHQQHQQHQQQQHHHQQQNDDSFWSRCTIL